MGDTSIQQDVWGKHAETSFDHAGPASYTSGGETLGSGFSTASLNSYGLRSIRFGTPMGLSISGNYYAKLQFTGTGMQRTAKLLWYPATAQAGAPLQLGAATAASTVSAVVSKVGTVTVANTFKAGNFVYLQSFTQLGALNGTIVRLATATATGVTFNLGTAANVSSGADTTGTLQLVAGGATNNPIQTGASSPITNSLATSSTLTMTTALAPPVGSFVYIDGLVNGATANGVIVQVATSSATQFTAKWNGTGNTFTTAADTGTVWQLVTNGSALIITGPFAAITNSVATASSAGTAGVISLSAVQPFIPGNIGVIQGLTNGAIDNGIVSAVIATSLTNALFKLNSQTGAVTTGADAGTFALLMTGAPSGSGEVVAGTNLSGETIRIWLFGA